MTEIASLPSLMGLPPLVLESIPGSKFKRDSFAGDFVATHEGPTAKSNWLIPGLLVMSGYPRNDDAEATGFTSLLQAGIRVFVSLQEDDEISHLDRFPPYSEPLKQQAVELGIDPTSLEFLRFPVRNDWIPESLDFTRGVVDVIVEKIVEEKKPVLVHCWGGHGRTGTVVSCVLARLYPTMMLSEILLRVEAVHDVRVSQRPYTAPQVKCQFEFVAAFVGDERNDTDFEGVHRGLPPDESIGRHYQ